VITQALKFSFLSYMFYSLFISKCSYETILRAVGSKIALGGGQASIMKVIGVKGGSAPPAGVGGISKIIGGRGPGTGGIKSLGGAPCVTKITDYSFLFSFVKIFYFLQKTLGVRWVMQTQKQQTSGVALVNDDFFNV